MLAIGTDPIAVTLAATVGQQPHFPGTIHDDNSARQFGYRGALVPGIFLTAQLCALVVPAWGIDWLTRGTIGSRSRRPVYDSQDITIRASAVRDEGNGLAVDFEIADPDGNIAATGNATVPARAPTPPDPAAFPVIPIAEAPPPIAPGSFRPGDRFGTRPEPITPAVHAESLAYFRQTWPDYAAKGLVHPTHLQRFANRHAIESYHLSTPPIFVSGQAQHFAAVRVGDVLTTSGVITAVYERKGNHYYESEHVVISNGQTVAAHIRRTSIYAARRQGA